MIWLIRIRQETTLILSWFLILIKMATDLLMLLDIFTFLIMSMYSLRDEIDDEFSGLNNTSPTDADLNSESIVGQIQYYDIICYFLEELVFPVLVEFSLKLNLLISLERFVLLKYPLNYYLHFTKFKLGLSIAISLFIDLSLAIINYYMDENSFSVGLLAYQIFFIMLNCATILAGSIINLMAWRKIRYTTEKLKRFQTFLFLFGISTINCFTILPDQIHQILDLFDVDDLKFFVVFIVCLSFAVTAYPGLNIWIITITNPILKRSIVKDWMKLKETWVERWSKTTVNDQAMKNIGTVSIWL